MALEAASFVSLQTKNTSAISPISVDKIWHTGANAGYTRRVLDTFEENKKGISPRMKHPTFETAPNHL
ncbi:hypothetical protein GCM10025791_02220 [Halioxenophilus aromaticivorans]|uniref:Uncharacterized protein n=1 Tax=Halioxenophilus aromaticivorans TaxID=1306992 RepID=A0AAV3TWE5_9ALTE